MTEHYSNIEDETFPSFLAESMNSNLSEALENCTISSTLGLPVAASTVTKTCNAFSRPLDGQASYLENEKSQPQTTKSALLNHSGVDGDGKFVLSFKDDLEDVDAFIKASNVKTHVQKTNLPEYDFEESSRKNDFSRGLCKVANIKPTDKTFKASPLYVDTQLEAHTLPDDPLSSSAASFLENEKLMSVASLDGSSSDELDDEEIYDDQLEAYFKKLLPLGMQRGVIEGQEIQDPKKASDMALNNFSSRTKDQASERLQYLEGYEEDFQMLCVRLGATGMDSASASDEEDVELELKKAAQQHLQREHFSEKTRTLTDQQQRPSFRPGLEGGSSEEESNDVQAVSNKGAVSACRQSAEGYGRSSPRAVLAEVDFGDGSSGSDDGIKLLQTSNMQRAASWKTDMDARKVAGEESVDYQPQTSEDRIDPVGNGEISKELKASNSSLQKSTGLSHDRQQSSCRMNYSNANAAQKLDSLYFQNSRTPENHSVSKSSSHLSEMFSSSFGGIVKDDINPATGIMETTDSNTADRGPLNRLADAYLSPSCLKNQRDGQESSDIWQSDQTQLFHWSFPHGTGENVGSPSHSVVYQNEEGKWVTDLAYYKSFENEQGVSFSGEVNDLLSNEDFVAGNNAIAMLDEDQKEFEKEHRFIQDEKMDLENISLNMGDTSWKLPNVLLKSSPRSDLCQEEASYLRLSLGEFFGQRSEALGCLGGGQDVKRPSFGYHIISPEKQEPIALLKECDNSENSGHNDTIMFCDNTLMPEDLGCLPDDQKIACTTFDVKAPDSKQNSDKPVEEHKESLTSNAEDQQFAKGNNLKSAQTPDETILNMSTIASAIANASCSANPSELAAMLIALSNKHKKMYPADDTSEHQQSTSRFLHSSVGKSSSENIFDMEKYLKATNNSGQDTEYESFANSVKDFTWDTSLGFKHPLQDSAAVLGNITDVQKQELREPENSREVHCIKPLLINDVSKGVAVKHNVCLGDNTKTMDSQSCLRNSASNSAEMSASKLGAYRASDPVVECTSKIMQEHKEKMLKTTCSSTTITPNINSYTLESDTKKSSQISGYKSSQKENSCLKSSGPSHQKTSRSPRKSSSRLSNDTKCPPAFKNSYNIHEGNSQKHVTFQPSPNGIQQKNCDCKTSPDFNVNTMEEEQYSFRPSTCPLIHSSPSQDSLKISDNRPNVSSESLASSERPSNAGLSPESSCLSPSLSRLTYVSATESTLQNTTIQSPEKKKSNNTIELSTTIVRASPTPSEIPIAESNALSWQQDKGQMSSDIPKQMSRSPSVFRSFKTHGIGAKIEESIKPEGKKLEPKYPVLNCKDKMNTLSSGLIVDIKDFQAPITQVDNPFSWQEFTARSGQELSNVNIPQSSLLDKCNAIQNIPGNPQFVVPPVFKTVLPAAELPKLPSSVPTLLTGQPLSNTPFAQQYLGNINPIPPYPVGNHLSCHSCTLQTQNTQSTGIPQSTNFASGLLATLPVSNQTSANQNIGHHIHLLESQAGTTGFTQWTTRMSSGFGQVLVTEEVTFPSACCVGIASQASLNIFNPNERWMQVNLGIISIAVDGEKIDTGADQCLVFKNKTIIGPRASEDIKILLLPQRPGLFQCVLSVSSWPVSADTETIVRAETMASKVLLTAVSEYPVIEMDSGKSDGLDFGDLSSGSWKTLPVKLINKTRATVPIRLTISANASAWRCFNFLKDPTNLTQEFPAHSDLILKMSSPSVISHVMRASFDGQEPEVFLLWVVFHAPQAYNSSGSLGPPEEFLARVDVEVDSPGPTCLLKSIPLRARAGCARIHAPKDLQTIHFKCSVGSSAKQLLPLKNAGNIATHLKVKCISEEKCFTVDPEDLFLVPGEEQVVTINFTPQYSKTKQSFVKIMVQPSGPQYEVTLIGEADLPGNKNSMNLNPTYSDVPPILSNRQFMSWGGVEYGRTVQQKLILRNTSAAASQHLRLLIRGQDQDCFQLQSTFGREERLTSNRELTIRPKEDAVIQLMFSPTRIGCMLAKLEIKQSGIKSSQPGTKFTIPLSGYGGTSNIILEGVKKLSDSYLVTLNGVSPGVVNKVSFSIRNTGSRAAYVKAVCFANFQKSIIMDPNSCCVTPDKFVLKEGTHELVTIFYSAPKVDDMLNQLNTLCTVCFCCGDEVSRQQFRRALLHKSELVQKTLAENAHLKNIRFDEEFPGEQLVSEVYDLPLRPNDIQLFYGNMHKIILSVVGSDPERSRNSSTVQPSLSTNLAPVIENVEIHNGNASLDILPVKGPQESHLPNVPTQNDGISAHTWSVQPEILVLRAPTSGGLAGTGQIQIVNNCTRVLQFDLSWPAHYLTITPQHGSIEPQSRIIILVSPNPSISTKHTLLPWNGQIYVHCENGQKIVKVQISDLAATSVSVDDGRPKPLPAFSLRQETPVHVAKPLPKSPSAKIEIKNNTLVFPKTTAGESSETFLDIENPSEQDMKWLLSSFAPPYVKGIDHSGDMYRATYAAFRCSRVSGVLAAHDKLKVAITFFPRERGDYTQFWDLECHPISDPHLKHKVRFQLCGEGISKENVSVTSLTNSLVKTEVPVKPRRRSGSEASSLKPVQDGKVRGVIASETLYTFPPTLVGEFSALKVNLQNNSFTTYLLKFISPKEPFHMKYSKFSLRAHHYIKLPVKFKPSTAGRFEGLLVVQTEDGDICIQLVGEALAK